MSRASSKLSKTEGLSCTANRFGIPEPTCFGGFVQHLMGGLWTLGLTKNGLKKCAMVQKSVPVCQRGLHFSLWVE